MAMQTMTHPGQVVSPRLDGKIAIITGASRGIGETTARLFAQAGATVVLAARNDADMADIMGEIKGSGGEALAVKTGVADAAAVEALVRRTVDAYGRLDVAFNNAGMNIGNKSFTDISPEEFDRGDGS